MRDALACSSHNKRSEFMYLALPHSIHLAPFRVYSILLPLQPHEIVSSFIYTLLNSLLLDELIHIYAARDTYMPTNNSQQTQTHTRARANVHPVSVYVDRLSLLFHADLTANFAKCTNILLCVRCTQNGIIEYLYAYAGIYYVRYSSNYLVNSVAWMVNPLSIARSM